ncbi:MAG: YdcF family protein [Proteobacteria bacterium]|uniref:YdcF family protein n=1 Tax=Rudaea sp. TaxID=2136325 RepID=UPI00378337E6|nr:YdcF family protein [Pseudomonadota bacterium]
MLLLTSLLLSPLWLGGLLFVLGVALWHRLRRRLRIAVVVAGGLLLALVTPLVADALILWQESRAPSPQECASPPDAIVVLSGGMVSPPRDVQDFAALGTTSLRRLFAAVELFGSRHVTTFTVVGNSDYDIPQSEIMAELAVRLGVPRAAVRVETRSLTTWQNAVNAAALAPPLARRIWLVTSAVHMPRALYAFRAAGFEPCAWPAHSQYRAPEGPLTYLLPDASAARKAEDAIHEIVGEIAYRLGLHGSG